MRNSSMSLSQGLTRARYRWQRPTLFRCLTLCTRCMSNTRVSVLPSKLALLVLSFVQSRPGLIFISLSLSPDRVLLFHEPFTRLCCAFLSSVLRQAPEQQPTDELSLITGSTSVRWHDRTALYSSTGAKLAPVCCASRRNEHRLRHALEASSARTPASAQPPTTLFFRRS